VSNCNVKALYRETLIEASLTLFLNGYLKKKVHCRENNWIESKIQKSPLINFKKTSSICIDVCLWVCRFVIMKGLHFPPVFHLLLPSHLSRPPLEAKLIVSDRRRRQNALDLT